VTRRLPQAARGVGDRFGDADLPACAHLQGVP
jgi:hypothetical protein